MVQLNHQYDRGDDLRDPVVIKIVGIGGAGSNVLDRVMLDGIEAVELVAINTDVQSLTASVATQKVQMGRNLTRGLGSGGDPELGQAAAEEATEEIRSVLHGGTVIFLSAGLGGGTGSGAAPLVAKLAKEQNALVLAFAALPFSFEGRRRCQQAEESLEQLRGIADAVVCFENDRMAEITLPRMGIHEAFAAADLTISQSIRSIAELLQRPGLLRLGFDDICAVLRGGDARALFGYGEAEGENRAHDALAKALKNPLMNRGELLEEAFHAIVHICGGTNVTLGEVQIIMEELNRHINDQTQLFMGIGIDPRHGDRLSISLLSSLGEVPEQARPAPRPVVRQTTLPQAPPQLHDLPPSEKPALPVQKPVEQPRLIESETDSFSAPKETKAEKPSQGFIEAAGEAPEKPVAARPSVEEKPGPRPIPKPALKPVEPKKPEAKQETLQFEPVSRGRFEKSEPTIVDGQDLDVPTFLRKHIKK